MTTCCSAARNDQARNRNWLVAESDEMDLWDVRLRLHRCLHCSALWASKSACHGHQHWDTTLIPLESRHEFDVLVGAERVAKDHRLAALKEQYLREGVEWKWQ
jgi:hypothetical protein